jgi:small conductance mechanosensitive channel
MLSSILPYVYNEKLLKSILAVLIAFFAYEILKRFATDWLRRLLSSHFEEKVVQRRIKTIEQLVLSTLKVLLSFWLVFTILDLFGLDVKALILSAGIVGVAISFGAQSVVKDLIAGFLMLIEGQFDLGDYLIIGENEGIVVSISTRYLTLLAPDGSLVQVPFGTINSIVNKKSIQELIQDASANEIVSEIKKLANQEKLIFRYSVADGKLLLFFQDLKSKKKKIEHILKSVVGEKPFVEVTLGKGLGLTINLEKQNPAN